MGSFKDDTYQEEVPEHVDKSEEEWDDLSYHTQYYYVKDGRKEQVRKKERDRIKQKKERVDKIKTDKSCGYCDEDRAVCLDFHHISDKEEDISRMVNEDYSWERIEDEIKKCEVICSNCHRAKHAGLI